MTSGELSIEELLAAALRGESLPESASLDRPGIPEEMVKAAIYHGVAGLLIERPDVRRSWPARVLEPLSDQARAQSMWELRHRQLLTEALTALLEQGIRSLVMKGTALAYDLYPNPAARSRGDTDLLVSPEERPRAEEVLGGLGYAPGILGGVNAAFALQQPWTLALPDGSHAVDLHWQVMNAPSLSDLLPFVECEAHSRPLPRLSAEARTMDRVRLLIHTCLHRSMHCNTPYVVDGQAYYDSGRLIWSWDVHLLAQTLTDDDWSLLCDLASAGGVSGVCLQGLQAAKKSLGTPIPGDVVDRLQRAQGGDRNSLYFVRSRAVGRSWQDLRSFPGVRQKLDYAAARILPDPRFLRGKYPGMKGTSMPFLYARRLFALLRTRRGRAESRK